MNLEALIEANTKAMLGLTAALTAWNASSPKAATPPPAAQPKPATTPAAKPPVQAPVGAALTYDKDAKPLALKLVAKDKPKYLEILKKHGVEGGPQLKADQLPDFIADVKAALGA